MDTNNQSSKRQSNFELLRIISMILIVCSHYAYGGKFDLVESQLFVNKFIVQILFYGGKLGVNLFVLISGYFLVTSKFKPKKALNLWIKVTIHSIVIALIFYLAGYSIGLKGLEKALFPIFYQTYWFATTYFVMYILSDYINKFIKALSQKELLKFIIILTVILSILPTFFKIEMAQSNLFWFFLLYLIAAYIRLYDSEIFNKKGYISKGVFIYGLSLLSCLVLDVLGIYIPFFGGGWRAAYFSGMEKTTMLLTAVFLFMGFKNINMGFSKIINILGASTFGVYLIHNNYLVSNYIWLELFKNTDYYNSPFLILHAAAAITIVYVVCTLISIFYNYVIEKNILKLLDFKKYNSSK